MKRFPLVVVVVAVLALFLGAGTASAAPLGQYTTDLCTGGTASASNAYYSAAYAFDDGAGYWSTQSTVTSAWLQYQFTGQQTVAQYTIRATGTYPGTTPSAWTFQASDTGAFAGEQVTLDSRSGQTGWAANEIRTYEFANGTAYLYYRFSFTHSQNIAVQEVEMMASLVPTPTPVATSEAGDIHVYVDYPTPVPQYFDPTANAGDGPEPWLVRFYVGVFATFTFTYVLFRLVDQHQFYLLFMALCMGAAWVTKSVNGAAVVYIFMLIMVLSLKLWDGLRGLVRFNP